MKPSNGNGKTSWTNERELIIHRLDEQGKSIESLHTKLDKLISHVLPKVGALEVKASIFGVVGAALVLLIKEMIK